MSTLQWEKTRRPGAGVSSAARENWFLALHIPDFPLAAAMRNLNAAAREKPCAVPDAAAAGRAREKSPLLAINQAARETGISRGWPLAKALLRCPDLALLERDPEAEAHLSQWLLTLGEGVAAEFEWTRPDTVIVDLSAKTNASSCHFNPPLDDLAEVRWAKALTPDLADLAVQMEALQGQEINPRKTAKLSIEAFASIGANSQDLDLLTAWGVRTVGDFMALPGQALAERMGQRAKVWQELLSGRICRPIRHHIKIEKLSQFVDFEDSVTNCDFLFRVLEHVLETIASDARKSIVSIKSLKLSLVLDSGVRVDRVLRLAEPQRSVSGMLPVVGTYLESLRLPGGVERVELEAETGLPKAVQREWFGRRELPQPARWAETLGRLEALLGPERLGVPVPPSSHRPDDFSLRPALGGAGVASDYRPEVSLPLRRYRPPLPVSVAGEWSGCWRRPLALLTGAHAGRVVAWRGPYALSGDWWDESSAWRRVEWDVAVEGGKLLRLAWLPPEEWRMEGEYE